MPEPEIPDTPSLVANEVSNYWRWPQELVAASGTLAVGLAVEAIGLGWRVARPGLEWLKYQTEVRLDIGSALSDSVRRGQPASWLRQASIDFDRAQQEDKPKLIEMAQYDMKLAREKASVVEQPEVRMQIAHITKVHVGSLAKRLMKGHALTEDERSHYKNLLDEVMGEHTFLSLGIDSRYVPYLEKEFPGYSAKLRLIRPD